jgi:hypothetical protein
MQDTLEREDTIGQGRKKPKRRDRRRGFQARARGGVLVGIVLFVLVQVALRVTIEEYRPELRDPTFEIKYRQLTRLMHQFQQPPVTVLFMGSSMTAYGIKADMVDEPLSRVLGRSAIGFNLGINNGGPFTQLVYVRRLLRRGVRPHLVVLELTPIVHDFADAPHDIARFPSSMLSRHDLDTVERFSCEPHLRDEWWQSYLVPIYGHRLTILDQSARVFVPFNDRLEYWLDMDSHGWRRVEIPSSESHRESLTRVKKTFGPRMRDYEVGRPPLRALREVTDLLAQARIPTVMVVMPEGPLLRSCYGPGSLKPLMDEFANLSRAQGFPIVQAREWIEEEKFTDSFHLTHEGATELTERLVREVICPTMTSLQDLDRSADPQRTAARQGSQP